MSYMDRKFLTEFPSKWEEACDLCRSSGKDLSKIPLTCYEEVHRSNDTKSDKRDSKDDH